MNIGIDISIGGKTMPKKFLGRTVQLYTTSLCKMNCPHCSSRLQTVPGMTLATFEDVVKDVEVNGARRIELFANDPLLHPEIEEQVEVLNKSGLGYAILTVGASPSDSSVRERFFRVMRKIDRERGGFVFSVDYSEETAKKILIEAGTNENTSYAFKANTFWELAPLLQMERIPVRINVVISRYNIDEVVTIMRRAAEMGFATSFCFVQHRQAEFDEISNQGFTSELEGKFRKYLHSSGILALREVDEIVRETKKITENELEDKKDPSGEVIEQSPFNAFRGNDRSEGEIPIRRLAQLRHDILALKDELRDKILPSEDFIREIGNRGFGCIKLLKQGQFPQMKVGSEGQMLFCCDLHDPYTSRYSINEMDEGKRRDSFLEMIRINPYIWTCLYFNPCDFSVNRVVYDASVAKV